MTTYNFYYPYRFRQQTKLFGLVYPLFKEYGKIGREYKRDALIQSYYGEVSQEIKNSKFFNFLHYSHFEETGSNIFHFKKEILELLQQTDVSAIQLKNIQFPYTCFYLSLRELALPLTIATANDTIIDGVYIEFSKNDNDYSFISFEVCGYAESQKEMEFANAVEDKIYASASLNFENEENSIAEAITLNEQIIKETFENKKATNKNKEREIDFMLEEYKLLKDHLNLFVNCILYLSSISPDIKEIYGEDLPKKLKEKINKADKEYKQDKVKKELQKQGFSTIKIIGNSFVNTNNSQQIGNKELAPHWRRGHWRNQPFGKEMAENKLIWIQPTIVNKEKGNPTQGHIYKK